MKKLATFFLVLFGFLAGGFSQTCEVPPNYFQDANFEHKLSPLVWTGAFDWISWGAWQPYTHPDFWVTDTTETHSGKKCLVITANAWIWPGVTTVGFEEKSMKMSFWYKAPLGKMGFWMFFYRDAKLTREEIRPPVNMGDLVGADTAYITLTAGTTDDEAIYFEMPAAKDWTYFEFKFDYPGSILGPAMTLMFWSEFTPGFIDDAYYGIDYNCVYNGEEPVELTNPDFEAEQLGPEWLINGGAPAEFVTTSENHTDLGSQSLQLWQDHAATYYMPAMGTEGNNMDLNFWHKGNAGTLSLNFYEDYGVGTDAIAVPEGATLIVDSIPDFVTENDTLILIDSIMDHSQILSTTETGNMITELDTSVVDTVGMFFQDFEVGNNPPLPIDGQWSGYYYADWAATMPAHTFFSPLHALYLPGDPGWTGVWGAPVGFVDNKAYSFDFMYKGKLNLELYIGRDLKYPLADDPEGIVPENATVTESGAIRWDLDASDWTKFSFAWPITTWLADSLVTSPASIGFNLAGTAEWNDIGYVDDLHIAASAENLGGTPFVISVPEVTNTYALDRVEYDTIVEAVVVDTLWTLDPLALTWDLPASAEWTPFSFSWTNPLGDIGSTLTMILTSTETQGADSITFFDDFKFGIPTGIKDHESKSLSIVVYPNPASDVLYLKTSMELKRASFYNTLGQQVKTIDNPVNQLSLSGLTPGVYILQVTNNEGVNYKARFVKK
jgi:hypothetical protein